MNYQQVNINAGQVAQQGGSSLSTINNANDLVNKILGIGNIVIYVLVSLAVVFIVYNVVWYMIKGNEPEAKKEAAKNLTWGIVGLAIIVSLWGLVNIIVGTFKTGTGNLPNLPNADFVNTSSNVQGGPLIDAPAGWGQNYKNAI